VDMRVGLFRYSDKVDRKTAIPLDRHKNREDFIFDVDRIPAKPDGEQSKITFSLRLYVMDS